MIQEINEKFDNRFYNFKPDKNDSVICFRDNKILLSFNGNEIDFPDASEIDDVIIYLFEIGGGRFFLGNADEFGRYRYFDTVVLRAAKPTDRAFAGITAYQLYRWYSDNKFCGRCGKAMRHSTAERAMVCGCGNTVYPKISPAVIVAIISDDKICLTKYNRENAKWALVAGFNEIGETIEETVIREVMEEVGLRVRNLTYYKSQPWGFTSTMLYGFYCQVDGDDEIKLDNVELKAGRWFAPDEIDFDNDGLSLTREMIDNFKHGKIKLQ